MIIFIYSFMLVITISSLIFLILKSLSTRSHQDREKMSPFECGFDPNSLARMPFSLRFFLLAVLFLVFDIEIVILLPSPLAIFSLANEYFMITFIMFIMILILGLIHEWNEGSLDWSQ